MNPILIETGSRCPVDVDIDIDIDTDTDADAAGRISVVGSPRSVWTAIASVHDHLGQLPFYNIPSLNFTLAPELSILQLPTPTAAMGRAPTSGNCHTCRMRRVKCDRARPTCERCAKAGYECKGYETVLRIQSHSVVAGAKPGTARLAKIQTVSSFPAAGPDEAPMTKGKRQQQQKQLVRAKPGAVNQPQRLRPQSQSSGNSSSDSVVHRSRTASASPPPELSLTGFVDDIAFSYFFDSYGWINMHSILLQDSGIRNTLSDGDMAYDSLRALAYGLLGKDRHIQSLQSQGARLYGNTLRKLRSKLSTQSKDELACLIKPIAIMGSYLISVENDLRFTHHRGLSRILEYCGPEYFQSPSLLPVFDSCRLTMISNSIVRRTPSFLAGEEWKTVPWAKAPHLKTWTSRLLDLMTEIPTVISGVLNLMGARIMWYNNGFPTERAEDPDVVPSLQRRVEELKEKLANWRIEWEAAHPDKASKALAWAFNLTDDDQYRPGIMGFAGPDLYDYSVLNSSNIPPPAFLQRDQATFTLMQEVTLYTTVLIWTARLTKYLTGAAMSHTNINFYNSSFSTTCTCCTSKLADMCDTVPESDADVMHVSVQNPDMSWNFTAARIAIAPVRVSPSDASPVTLIPVSPSPSPESDLGHESPRHSQDQEPGPDQPLYVRSLPLLPSSPPQPQLPRSPPLEGPSHPRRSQQQQQQQQQQQEEHSHDSVFTDGTFQTSGSKLPTPPTSATFVGGKGGFPQRTAPAEPQSTLNVVKTNPPMLLPGDVRFTSQLRILSWLTSCLPASRPQVLTTLASIGLGHCGHDVRPVDGLPEVANVVRKAFSRTNFENADHVLLRRYR